MYPWALLWANDRYYLYGYDIVETDGKYRERHYRVDKLANIELTDTPKSASIYITADQSYVLYLNGELISRGLPLPEGILTEERLAEELCALKSKI